MHGWLAAIILAHALDAGSTQLALGAGAAEGNPALRWSTGRPAVLWAVQGTLATGEGVSLRRLEKSRPRLARGLAWAIVVAHGTAAAWNLKVYRAQRGQGRTPK